MFETQTLVSLGVGLAVFYIVPKILGFRRAVQSIGDWPGFRTIFSDRFLWFPFTVPGISPGPQRSFYKKYQDFAQAGVDVVSAVNYLPTPQVTYYVADPAIAKEIVGARARFPKPLEFYDILAAFGSNILVTEGDEWKRQRKIAAPAFSEKNNRLVWDETVLILHDLFHNVWGDREVVELDNAMDITVGITLLVIGVAGFGRRISWNEDSIAPQGHSMTFKAFLHSDLAAYAMLTLDALNEVSHRLFLRILFPDWILRWGTPSMRHFIRAFEEIKLYLAEMVEARRAAKTKEERYDLFSNLLDANEDELDSAAKLTDEKLVGNVFLFLVAGYETTAHTLAYALILLALNPEEQEAFYQNIKSVLPEGREPTYDDFSSLSYSLAVFNETLRWFPPVVDIPKQSAEDTTFTTTNAAGEKIAIPVPRGSYITLCAPSLHHNPKYFDEPSRFRPARFLDPGSRARDAFLPFSGGPRGCIGRGFAETEAVAALTLLVARFRVTVREEARFAGETREARAARLLRSQHSLTIYPERAPLVLTRR
ncbi:cytochrome P450 [Epithele typhae]|uniref:cytochrome P450 n=1 Tax=Epithele typhae TaxID=378194 RepID=UPI002008A84A|nr:cytochrome P450 [Epithele typhae]KAH9941623.1 cytochrome P450 [Epithele typhae]